MVDRSALRFANEDIFIDYEIEEVMFRWDHIKKLFFRKFYEEQESGPISHQNRLCCDALLYGDEITNEQYLAGKQSYYKKLKEQKGSDPKSGF